MDLPVLLVFLVITFVAEIIYFKIADQYNIIDHPNHRSSHTQVTIRGGGVIFSIALLIGALYLKWEYGYFIVGLLIISLISFLDDIKPRSNKIRISFHVIAVMLLFYQLSIYSLPFYWIIIAFVFVIGTINAINFMDGINGITGGFALTTLLTLYYINQYVIFFTNADYLAIAIIALLVFNFFNFRTIARCFAGDVGSVSIGFIILFFLLQLIIKTGNINYILFLLMYGLDTISTILFRLLRKDNVFEAHRTHFYQFLANEKKMPHLLVATIYVLIQLSINIVIINFLNLSVIGLLIVLVVTASIFFAVRIYFEGMNKLLGIK